MQRTVLGLYLAERFVHAIALEQNPSGMLVRAMSEWESTLFNYAGDDTPGVDEFVERLSHFVAANEISAKQVTITLESSLVFLHTVPFLDSATPNGVGDQLQWELSEYFPGVPAEKFITDMHVLGRMVNRRNDNVLMVAVRSDIVQKIHRALARLKLRLDIVDVDHFSADTALRHNFPDVANKLIALVGVKESRLDMSILRYNEMESYTYAIPTSPNSLVKKLKAIEEGTRGLTSIALYGTGVTRELLTRLRESATISIEAVNPFRSIDVASSVRMNNDPTLNAFRYCAVVGVALRRD